MENETEYVVNCEYINPCNVIINETNLCPICKKNIKPVFIYGTMYNRKNKDYLSIMYQCKGCGNYFIAQYSDAVEIGFEHQFNKLEYLAPNKFCSKSFDKIIEDYFPRFVQIYNQALEAEHNNLNEIAGMGYRKALEFLVKDFLIKEHPENEKDIEKTALGTCIENYIDNDSLKSVAKRATWLGNDQVHYMKVYTDNDVEDLKKLIELSVHWISMIYLTKDYEKKINKK